MFIVIIMPSHDDGVVGRVPEVESPLVIRILIDWLFLG